MSFSDQLPTEPAVFVDRSGRRLRVVRAAGCLLIAPAVAYVGLLAGSLVSTPGINSHVTVAAQPTHEVGASRPTTHPRPAEATTHPALRLVATTVQPTAPTDRRATAAPTQPAYEVRAPHATMMRVRTHAARATPTPTPTASPTTSSRPATTAPTPQAPAPTSTSPAPTLTTAGNSGHLRTTPPGQSRRPAKATTSSP